MNHPKPEQWVPYLYGEASADARRELRDHLCACAECRAQFQTWKRSLGRLNDWKVPRVPEPGRVFAPLLRWAAAALVVLALGFLTGRSSARPPDLQSLRAALEPRLRQELRQELALLVRHQVQQTAADVLAATGQRTQEMLTAFDGTLQARRAEDGQALRAAIERLEIQNVSLKKEIDTMAWNTDTELRQARQQLFQLADSNQPGSSPKSTKD